MTKSASGPVIYDGVALDTVGAYLRPDFNAKMLAVASHPLAYDPDSGAPVALEHLGLSAFMTELRDQLPDRVSIASNGFPISGTLGQGVDHFVRELVRRWRKNPGDVRPQYYHELYDEDLDLRLRRVYRTRMVALQRPMTFWARFVHTEVRARERGVSPEQALITDMRTFLPLYTATGVYVFIQRTGIDRSPRMLGSPQDPQVMDVYRHHLDTVHALHQAGWQPVPYARVQGASAGADGAPTMVIERFGGAQAGDEQLLTVYNPDARERAITLVIEWSTIGQGKELRSVRDWHTGARLTANPDPSGAIRVGLTVASNTVRVLSLK